MKEKSLIDFITAIKGCKKPARIHCYFNAYIWPNKDLPESYKPDWWNYDKRNIKKSVFVRIFMEHIESKIHQKWLMKEWDFFNRNLQRGLIKI